MAKKIMFNDRYGLTESVLEGRKTMTRRFCKDKDTNEPIFADDVLEPFIYYDGHGNIESITFIMKDGTERISVPQYRVGEVLAVAQSYKDLGYTEEWVEKNIKPNPNAKWIDPFKKEYPGWNNKMFVKESFMSHHVKITDIKVERLQDISDEECMREGIYRWKDMEDCPESLSEIQRNRFGYYGVWDAFSTPRKAFASLIDKVSGKGTWERNPYVFPYSFELVDL